MFKRKNKLQRGGPLPRSRDRIRRVGKQGLANAKALRVFKKEMAKLGIDSCEVMFKDCTGDYFLTWAHGKRRRFLTEQELATLAVVACQSCHATLDLRMSHADCEAKVRAIIARRTDGRAT